MSTSSQWRGVIEEYRDLLDLPEGLEAVTLREGGTPLVHSGWLSGLTGGEVWLKVEANNPTGSFKDRGMTAAISVARHEGDRAGVLAQVATAFSEHGVSIQTVRQEGRDLDAQLVVVSHEATDAQLSATVETLRGLEIVREVTSVMRVEGESE